MKTFYVLENKEIDDKTAVKKGFSWPALFFGAWWAMWHDMWLLFAILFTLTYGIRITEFSIGDELTPGIALILFLVSIVAWLIPAFMGNKWRVHSFSKQGYQVVDEMQANSIKDAYNFLIKEAEDKAQGSDISP